MSGPGTGVSGGVCSCVGVGSSNAGVTVGVLVGVIVAVAVGRGVFVGVWVGDGVTVGRGVLVGVADGASAVGRAVACERSRTCAENGREP